MTRSMLSAAGRSALVVVLCSCSGSGGDPGPGGSFNAAAGSAGSTAGGGGGSGGTASGGATATGGTTASGGVAGLGGAQAGGTAGEPGARVVDPSTLTGKVMFGYQGWFSAPGDGSQVSRWHHWFKDNTPDEDHLNIEMWPDLSEFDADELFDTQMTRGGEPARLYSAYKQKSVVRHFQWMREHDLDGVFLQRFLGELKDDVFREFRDEVTAHVVAGSEQHGRTFAIMWDGISIDDLVPYLKADWMHLVDELKVTESSRYLHHDGKPIVAIWGLGFNHYNVTAAQAQELIDWFQRDADAKYQATVMGGIPEGWRTLTRSSRTEAEWAEVYRSLDVISPWSVGRYGDDAGIEDYRANYIVPDLAECEGNGIDYLPVVWPGFSWFNLHAGEQNEIARDGGNFYWKQAAGAVQSGSEMLYVAMFDEVDEATAMFKIAETQADVPDQGYWLTLDADGTALPSDWYLQLGNQTGKMLRGEIATSSTIPIEP